MKKIWMSTFICLLLSVLFVPAQAQQAELLTKKALSLDVAKEIAMAAAEYAQEKQWNVVIAIVDDGANLVYFERMDGVQIGSVEVGIQKAVSSISFKRPTKAFQDALVNGRTALVALPGGMSFDGGVPIIWEDQIIGAIGVSGVTSTQDGMIAQAGADALQKILGK